jgi:bacteriorhodopsin
MSVVIENVGPDGFWTTENTIGIVSAGGFLLAASLNVYESIISRLTEVRSSKNFRTRVIFCASVQLNMFLISMFCNIIGVTELDDLYIPWRDVTVNVIKYVDWMITCPMLQLILLVLSGPDCKVNLRMHLCTTSGISACGLVATLVPDDSATLKSAFFFLGLALFARVGYNMDQMVVQVSRGQASMVKGGHALRTLTMVMIFTWVWFPATWAMSTDGFGIVPSMNQVFPAINMVSKVSFVLAFRKCMGIFVQSIAQFQPSEKGYAVGDHCSISVRGSKDCSEYGDMPKSMADVFRRKGTSALVTGMVDAEVHCNLGEDDLAAALTKGQEIVPTSDELVATVRYVAQTGQIAEDEVQRVIHNLAKNWVLTEAAIIDLSPDDLRRLDVPVGLVACLRGELVEMREGKRWQQGGSRETDARATPRSPGGFGLYGCCSSEAVAEGRAEDFPTQVPILPQEGRYARRH